MFVNMHTRWHVLLTALGIMMIQAMNSQKACDMDEKCLKVFDHEPKTWPKCYCTSLCQDSLTHLYRNCTSGQALWDNCGICLRCAKARGERCGGPHNVDGMCASGLACLVKVDPLTPPEDIQEIERNSFGRCVDETSNECPRTGRDRKKYYGINCRPGRVGILLEALYCPDFGQCHQPKPAPPPTRPFIHETSTKATTEVTSDQESDQRNRKPFRPFRRPSEEATPSVSFISVLLNGR